jgi:hypothetical protein
MQVTYQPEDPAEGDEAVWNFRPSRIRESRGEMIEKRYAKLLGEKSVAFEAWRMAVLQGQSSARRVLLWHLRDLTHPGKIRIEDVDPYKGELTVDASKSELLELRGTLEQVAGLDDEQRELMLASIDAQILAAPDDDGGKAPSPTSEDATG